MTLTVESLQRHPMMRGVQGLERLLPHFESIHLDRGVQLNTGWFIYFSVTARFGVHELVQENQHFEITLVYPGEATTVVQHLEDHGMRTLTRVVQGGLVFRVSRGLIRDCPTLISNIHKVDQRGMARVLKTLTCSLEHNLEQRIARYLLTQGDPDLNISQNDVAIALGCRREGVTEVYPTLVKNGVYHSRGRVIITDREKLQTLSCGCEKHILPKGYQNG